MLDAVGNKLNECTNVDVIKKFLKRYSHPLYPEKRYIEPHVYCDAKTVADILDSLFPQYINYMEHYVLEEIVDKFGDTECRECFQKYEQFFRRSMRKLRDHPAPLTDEEIEQSSGQKRLKVTISGDTRATTPHDVYVVLAAIEQTTGVGRAGQVFAYQDPGNSVTLTLLVPDCVVQLFHGLCDEDLTVLADAGITRIQVEDLEIPDISEHTTEKKAAQISCVSAEDSLREAPSESSLVCYLEECQDISSKQRADFIAMLRSVPDRQRNEVCSKQVLLELSRHIQNWEMLAPFLGKDIHFDKFKARYPGIEEQNYQLLLLWRRREGSRATYCHLLETLTLHGTGQEAKALIQILLTGLLCVFMRWV